MGGNFCPVDDVLDSAFSWHGVFFLLSPVAFDRFCVGYFVEDLSVRGRDDRCHAIYETAAHFQGVFITYFARFMIFWTVFVYRL